MVHSVSMGDYDSDLENYPKISLSCSKMGELGINIYHLFQVKEIDKVQCF